LVHLARGNDILVGDILKEEGPLPAEELIEGRTSGASDASWSGALLLISAEREAFDIEKTSAPRNP
jgi:hypothetical protein